MSGGLQLPVYPHMQTDIKILYFYFLVFQDRVFLGNSPGCPGTISIEQEGLELTEIPPASAFKVPPPPSNNKNSF